MAVLGVLVRIERSDRESIVSRLGDVDGANLVSLEEDGRVGLLIEADTMDEARRILASNVDAADGVLATWPVFAHYEDEMNERAHETPSDSLAKSAQPK